MKTRRQSATRNPELRFWRSAVLDSARGDFDRLPVMWGAGALDGAEHGSRRRLRDRLSFMRCGSDLARLSQVRGAGAGDVSLKRLRGFGRDQLPGVRLDLAVPAGRRT